MCSQAFGHSANVYAVQSDLVITAPMAYVAISKVIEWTVIWCHLFKKKYVFFKKYI